MYTGLINLSRVKHFLNKWEKTTRTSCQTTTPVVYHRMLHIFASAEDETGIILGMGSANERRRYVASHWLSLYPEWSMRNSLAVGYAGKPGWGWGLC